jgi:hypothetical protein
LKAENPKLRSLAANLSPADVMSDQPNWDVSCVFLVPNSEAEYAVQQAAQVRAEAAVLAVQESDNANRILIRAQQARAAAASAFDRKPTAGNRKALALAETELNNTQKRFGKIAALLAQRQEASIAAQRAACGEGRTSWAD